MSSNLPPGPSLAPAPTAIPAAALGRWLGRMGLGKPGGLIALALLLVALAGLVLAWGLRSRGPAPASAQALRIAEAHAPETPQHGIGSPAHRRTDMPLAEPEPSGLPVAPAGTTAVAPPLAPPVAPSIESLAPPPEATAGANLPLAPVTPRAPEAGLLQAAAQDIKTLLDHQQRQAERIEQLGQQLASLTAALDRMQARQVAARRVVRRVAAAPVAAASAPAASAPAQAQLLSVDMWDGRPSVVIGTDSAEDRRVRFLAEGDRQSGIALKQASPHEQRAVFDVAGREVVLDREGRR